jgi:predicted HAD superfamily Cof-like phosphohydrolase
MSKLVDGKPIYREDGKVLKPEGWTPPDIKSIIENAKD